MAPVETLRYILRATRRQYSATSLFIAIDRLAFTIARREAGDRSEEDAKNHDEEPWGSDDPTKAAFPFLHGLALAEAGHEVRIFLLGEAVTLMRKSVASAVVPVGWPPLSETLDKIKARGISIYACGACSRARSVTETDLANYNAKYGNPAIFVSLVEWADRVISE
jgi:predicted peroxiredoxin